MWPRRVARSVWLTMVVSTTIALPFLLWKRAADRAGTYLARSMRLGLEQGHGVSAAAVKQTVVWAVAALLCAGIWRVLRGRRVGDAERWGYSEVALPVLLALLAGGLFGMNMQVVTGFNIQALHHFPHMVLQPLILLLVGGLIALASRNSASWRTASVALLVLGFGACAVAQFEAARDSAEQHRLTGAEQAMIEWLNQKTPVGSVVATDDLANSVMLPVLTHNSVLFGDGSRGAGSDSELMERFLLAARLSGTSPEVVEERLSSTVAPKDVPVATYTYYLFESSAKFEGPERRLRVERLPEVLAWYRSMDVGHELQEFRVDYLWLAKSGTPPPIAGWRWTAVYGNAAGSLWQLSHG